MHTLQQFKLLLNSGLLSHVIDVLCQEQPNVPEFKHYRQLLLDYKSKLSNGQIGQLKYDSEVKLLERIVVKHINVYYA
jgi:hypothetical protein